MKNQMRLVFGSVRVHIQTVFIVLTADRFADAIGNTVIVVVITIFTRWRAARKNLRRQKNSCVFVIEKAARIASSRIFSCWTTGVILEDS